MNNTEKQTVHDWATGTLVVYEIDASIEPQTEPPTDEPTDE